MLSAFYLYWCINLNFLCREQIMWHPVLLWQSIITKDTKFLATPHKIFLGLNLPYLLSKLWEAHTHTVSLPAGYQLCLSSDTENLTVQFWHLASTLRLNRGDSIRYILSDNEPSAVKSPSWFFFLVLQDTCSCEALFSAAQERLCIFLGSGALKQKSGGCRWHTHLVDTAY